MRPEAAVDVRARGLEDGARGQLAEEGAVDGADAGGGGCHFWWDGCLWDMAVVLKYSNQEL